MSLLLERLRAQVTARPDATALEAAGRAWRYRDLDAAIAREAEALASRGLRRGDAFGWLGLNSAAMLIALFACARLGLRFVPLNWRLAAPELGAIVRHAGLAAWHADEGFHALDGLAPTPASGDPAQDDLLLVYTSGTTGTPKGALHTQAAMAANLDAAIDAQVLDAATRTLAVLPLFHVGGLCIQVLPTLAAGGTVRLHARFDPSTWFDDVQAWRPTTSLLVPATMRALLEHPRWPAADLSSLAFVNTGSSIVPRTYIEAFHARGLPVCQVYGSTETGPVTLVLRPEEALAHVGSVGRPARGVEVRLAEGEVCVRAPNLARGYHRTPDDPAFADGWFRTGDLAQVDADGYYEIVGRSKDMIISGGENIYPAEIENLALADPAVAEAAAVGVADARWGEVPVLALVARPGREVDTTRLQALFDARLARYKHPRRIVVLEQLPRTALGKVRKPELAQALGRDGGPPGA
ncbi:MAG TPA: AMP-binding protein [Burkholderiaceae bacterium]|nr:AMP-binding protein [Burkholderiaceae bacterium]